MSTTARQTSVLRVAVAANVVQWMTGVLLTPLYPVVARDLGLGADSFAALISIAALFGAISFLPAGIATDRFGRRRTLAVGLVGVAIVQILRWAAVNPVIFAASQAVVGMSGPIVNTASYAAVADAYSGSGRAQAIGTTALGANLGQVVGVLVAGAIGVALGWHELALFAAIPAIIVAAAVYRMPENDIARTPQALQSRVRQALTFLKARDFLALAGISALAMGAGNAALYLLPFVVQARGLSPTVSGALLLPFLVGAMAGGPIGGRVADRSGARGPMLAALASAAGAAVAIGGLGSDPIVVIPCYFVIGAATTIATSLSSSVVADLVDRSARGATGAALAGLGLGRSLGPTLFPTIAGAVYVRGGASAAYIALGLAFCVAAVIALGSRGAIASVTASVPETN